MTVTDQYADLVVVNGQLHGTGNASAAPTSLAIKSSKIIALGDEAVESLIGANTRIIDANGGAVLPGINDGHLHFVESAVSQHGTLSVGSQHAQSWDEVAAILQAATPANDGWIRAHGWDDVILGSGGPEYLYGLREDAPVVAYDQTGHQLLLNKTAARLAKLENHTDGYPDGVVGTFADGSANGLLVDAAVELAGLVIPQLSDADVRRCILEHQNFLHSLGITSLTEPGLGPGGEGLFGGSSATRSLRLLADLAVEEKLSLRINALLLFSSTGGANAEDTRTGLASDLPSSLSERGISEDQLRIAGVKIFADGIPRSGTAWMSEPYQTPCGHTHGSMVIIGDTDAARETELHRIISNIHAAGLQAGIHATGDATTAAAIRAIAAAQLADDREARHYIIHGGFSGAGDLNETLKDFSDHGVGLSTNPAIRAEAGALMKTILGADRFNNHQPLASFLDAGIPTNIASDAPVTSPDWRESIIAAITRDSTAGPAEQQDAQKIDFAQALAMMTSMPAWQDHAETRKGRLEPGLLADVCILEQPVTDDIYALRENRTAHTISNGNLVYSAG
ncbi:amidohydrolase [Arthrobacter sp. MYb227]|uniref:amidohydrolase n=1 Tax=Arthrobacter sp. MYb227 TaxID=1848601 RepID=UPI000CFE039D|nr:amidohydrolase family protein [Arthrobacter sp. MYb227]PQZ85757.1 amidohydrolase [Arthrobacter sp. MYb227]